MCTLNVGSKSKHSKTLKRANITENNLRVGVVCFLNTTVKTKMAAERRCGGGWKITSRLGLIAE